MRRWTARPIAVLCARRRLHRAASPARLGAIRDRGAFVERAFTASARNLAVASAFLPADVREAGAVAFLACRVLDAFEDLSPTLAAARRDVLAAAAYLTGRSPSAPATHRLAGERDSDRVEAMLAERMPLLRSALDALPPGRREAVARLVDRMSAAMAEALAARDDDQPVDRRRYASAVLGEAVAFALQLVGCRVTDEMAQAAGRVLQLANDIRDARPADDVLALAFGVVTDAPVVPRLLESLRFPARSGARAAIVYLALTTARFLLGSARIAPRALVRHPLALAVAAGCSASSYRRTVQRLDRWIHRAPPLVLRRYVTTTGEPPVHRDALAIYERPRGRAFATFLAGLHPERQATEALIAATWLGEQAGYFLRYVPETPLDDASPARRLFLLAGDHAVGSAVRWVAPLGPGALRAVGDAMVRTAAEAHATAGRTDVGGELARCISRIVGDARRLAAPEAELLRTVHVELACALSGLDRAVTRSAFRTAQRTLAATLERVERLAAGAPASLRAQVLRHRGAAAAIAAGVD